MRARQLEVFTAVMRRGPGTAAARLLNISQPALSQISRMPRTKPGSRCSSGVKGRLHPTVEALEIFPDAERLASPRAQAQTEDSARARRAGADRRVRAAGQDNSARRRRTGARRYPEIPLVPHIALRRHVGPDAARGRWPGWRRVSRPRVAGHRGEARRDGLRPSMPTACAGDAAAGALRDLAGEAR
ncbi:MAG: LysR family transcriptional regulator [Amaricoccus sp.]